MNMKYLLLITIVVLSLTESLNAQSNKLFFNVGYEADLSVSNTFNQPLVYYQNKFTNAGAFSFGIESNNIYFFSGFTIKRKTLDFPCITFEKSEPNTIQLLSLIHI